MIKTIQILISITVLISAFWGGIWVFTEKLVSAEDLKRMEQQTIQTFEKYQKKIDYRFNYQQLLLLKQQEYQIASVLRKDPKNAVAQEDYKTVKQQICDLEKEMLQDKKEQK